MIKQNVTADTAAETFVTEGLSKVIKMNNMCYSDNITDCGFPETFTSMNGTTINLSSILTLKDFNPLIISINLNNYGLTPHEQLNTKAAAFETANGESILVYYNPNCQANLKETVKHYTQPKMCANFVYDLNGQKHQSIYRQMFFGRVPSSHLGRQAQLGIKVLLLAVRKLQRGRIRISIKK